MPFFFTSLTVHNSASLSSQLMSFTLLRRLPPNKESNNKAKVQLDRRLNDNDRLANGINAFSAQSAVFGLYFTKHRLSSTAPQVSRY